MPGTVKSELLSDADRSHKYDSQEKVCWIRHLSLDKSHFITGGREEVSLTPMQSSRPEMPLSGIRLTWIARNSPIHHLLGLSIFAACLIRSYIGYVPEMPSMKLSSSTLGECSSLNG